VGGDSSSKDDYDGESGEEKDVGPALKDMFKNPDGGEDI